jgi:hypothetical protein
MLITEENRVSSVPFVPVSDGCRWYQMFHENSFVGLFDIANRGNGNVYVEIHMSAHSENGMKWPMEKLRMSFDDAMIAFGKMEFRLSSAFNYNR